MADLFDELLPRLDYVRVLSAFEPKVHGKQVNVKCPKCGVHDAYILMDGPQGPGRSIMCRRANSCGKTTPLLEIATGQPHLTGGEFLEGLKKLAIMGGANFNPTRVSAGYAEKQAERAAKLSVLESVQAWCGRQLILEQPRKYLEGRLFDVSLLSRFGFGYMPTVFDMTSVALGCWAGDVPWNQLIDLGFCGRTADDRATDNSAWNNRIIIPISDRNGRLVGFSGRAIDDRKPKYLNTLGLSVKALGATELNWALSKNKSGDLIAVEGWLDPFKARQHMIDNVVAIGTTGAALNAERWELLWDIGVRSLTLWLDSDRAGEEGLRKALEKHDEAKRKPDVYVTCTPTTKDLDEFIDTCVADGLSPVERVNKVMAGRRHADRHRAHIFLGSNPIGFRGLDGTINEAERWQFIRRCMDYDKSVFDGAHRVSLSVNFWPEVEKISGLDMSAILDMREELRKQRMKEEEAKAIANLVRTSQNCLNSPGGTQEAVAKLREGLDQIQQKFQPAYLSKAAPSELILSQDEARLRALSLCTSLGIEQGVLPALDNHLRGLRGLIVVGGASQTGKTIFVLQTALEALLRQPNLCVLFVSLEMEPFVLRNRMRSYLSRMSFDRVVELRKPGVEEAAGGMCRGEQPGGQCFKDKPCLFCLVRRRDEAELYLSELLPRFRILHELEPEGFVATTDTIINEARDLKAASGCSRCMVIIDYMDLLEVDESKYRTENQQEKHRVRICKTIRDANNQDAVLAISEVRKGDGPSHERWVTEDDFMGSARKHYGADQALIINRFTDEMLWRHFSPAPSGLMLWAEPQYDDADWHKEQKKQEVKREVKQIKELLQAIGPCFPLDINVCKVREVGVKGSIHVTIRWHENRIIEGLKL